MLTLQGDPEMGALLPDKISTYLAVAHHLADLSAKEILPHFRTKISVDDKKGKSNFDPVTIADQNAEALIRNFLNDNHNNHSIFGEEFGFEQKNSDFCWLIDPIDGTSSFVLGSPLWGTLIGLNYKDEPIIGLMNQPFTNERYWASPEGALGRSGGQEYPLSVRREGDLSNAIITTTSPDLFATDDDKLRFDTLRKSCKMTRYGGDCYQYCLLAMGHIDIIVESGLASYDIAPLIPIVKNAGGMITDWEGNNISHGGQVIAAGDARLHEAAIKILTG